MKLGSGNVTVRMKLEGSIESLHTSRLQCASTSTLCEYAYGSHWEAKKSSDIDGLV